jgi:hypothetical protein
MANIQDILESFDRSKCLTTEQFINQFGHLSLNQLASLEQHLEFGQNGICAKEVQ